MASTMKFDKKEPDTILAEEYMKKPEIVKLVNPEYINVELKPGSDNLTCQSDLKTSSLQNVCNKFIKLASEIEKNSELFCQLEFKLRHKSVTATKFELEMITKNLLYHGSSDKFPNIRKYGAILIKNDSPLIDLGNFASYDQLPVKIQAGTSTAAVCYLFTTLCNQVGFDVLFVMKVDHDDDNNIRKSKVLSGGCVGVVTEKSDVDSAVDIFIHAPNESVCGIRRILVQESICERLRKAFQWKAKLDNSEKAVDDRLKSLSSEIYVFDANVFLHEYVGNVLDLEGGTVVIEAYRTSKEAMMLLASCDPFCVSLWSSDVAECNEIAFGVGAPIVWVNGYGTTNGPAKTSQAYYSRIHVDETSVKAGEVSELRKVWAKLSISGRRKVLRDAVIGSGKAERFLYHVSTVESHARNFFHVANNALVMGVDTPRELYVTDVRFAMSSEFVEGLLKGSGFLIVKDNTDEVNEVVDLLTKSSVPVRWSDGKRYIAPLRYYTRVVWTSYGTIFAN